MEKTKITLTSHGYAIILSKNILKELVWNLRDEIEIDRLAYTDSEDKSMQVKYGLVIKKQK